MNNDKAQAYLSTTLSGLATADPSLDGEAELTEWYVIAVHKTADGSVFSRYTPDGQADWTDIGLLTLAAKLDERDLLAEAEDD